MVGLLGLFWVLEVWGLYPLVVQGIKLLQRCGRTIVPDGVARCLVSAKIRQVEKVARVAAVHQDCSLLGENLPAGLTQQRGTGVEKPLHLSSRDGRLNKQEHVCPAGLAAAHHHGEFKAPDLFYEAGVVQRILVNVNTAPDAGVISPDWDNSQTRFNAFQVLGPQVVSWWLAHHNGLACLFPVSSGRLNFVCSISDIQAGKNRFEPGYVGHFFFLLRVGPTHAKRGTRVLPAMSYMAKLNYRSPEHFRPLKSKGSRAVSWRAHFTLMLYLDVTRADRQGKFPGSGIYRS